MSNLEPLICPQCGAQINRNTYKCEYCGTEFKKGAQVMLYQVEVLRPGVRVLRQDCRMSWEMIHAIGVEEASKIALNQMAREIAQVIAPFMDACIENDPSTLEYKLHTRLRVVEPTYRF